MKAIVLTMGKIATVDDEDFDRVNQFKWHTAKRGRKYYARRNLPEGSEKHLEYLHDFILGAIGVDHRDGDGLENRRQNLRVASNQQNHHAKCNKPAEATSKFRGVRRYRGKCWTAQLTFNARQIHLGQFDVEEDAARAYDAKAIELFGEFASPNFKQIS